MERKRYIDILKIASAFSIVLLHVNSNSLHAVENFLSEVHVRTSLSLHQLFYLAVPIFVILTGCGLLSSGQLTYKRMWPRLRKLLVCIVLFGSVFEAARIVLRGEPVTPKIFVLDLIKGTTWSHMWYLNVIFVIYLIAPLLGVMIERLSRKALALVTLCLFIVISVFPLAMGLCGIAFPFSIPKAFVFVPLVLAGYLIDTMDDGCIKRVRIPALAVAILGATEIFIWAFFGDAIILENNPIAVVTSLGIVVVSKGFVKNVEKREKFTEEFSRSTLGIYIIHPAFLHLYMTFVDFNPHLYAPLITVPILAAVFFVASWGIIHVLRKIGFVRKYIL